MLDGVLDGLRATSPAEIVSVLAGLAYGVLAVRQDRRCWVFGGISSSILAWLAAQARLPMQSLLQVAYVLMAGYGFWHWSRASAAVAGAAGDGGRPAAAALAIGVWPWKVHGAIAVAIAVGTAALAPWVAEWTAAAWPRLDTATMLASLLATWMVARVRLENWLYWIVIDAVSLYLYAAQGLAFVALLYLVYLVIAVFGWFEWRGRLRRQSAAAGA
jgi:nicotinamide mononucleotide transporter